MPRSVNWPLTFKFCNYNFLSISHLSHECFISYLSHPPWYENPENIWRRVQIMNLSTVYFSASYYFLQRPGCKNHVSPLWYIFQENQLLDSLLLQTHKWCQFASYLTPYTVNGLHLVLAPTWWPIHSLSETVKNNITQKVHKPGSCTDASAPWSQTLILYSLGVGDQVSFFGPLQWFCS
jgi:hypothetical protein